MPVRKVTRNYRNVTGVLASSKSIGYAEFESTLERDFQTILEFDNNVEKYEVQPVKIYYQDNNILRYYTPDILVYYNSPTKTPQKTTVLYEVKYRKDIKENWQSYRLKFKAAYSYACKKGWKFKIISEREIRTTYLENIKFLINYRTAIDDTRFNKILTLMQEFRETTPEVLVAALANDSNNKAEIIFLIWQMLSKGYIESDFSLPLSMKMRIWLPNIM